jgi:hypothetical protein
MAQIHLTRSTEPRPKYFLIRPSSGKVVPLIPVDELPINLSGIGRSMELEETVGMLNLGFVAGGTTTFEAEGSKDMSSDM